MTIPRHLGKSSEKAAGRMQKGYAASGKGCLVWADEVLRETKLQRVWLAALVNSRVASRVVPEINLAGTRDFLLGIQQ